MSKCRWTLPALAGAALVFGILVDVCRAAPPTDEAVQGLYEGTLKAAAGPQKFEARVVALGKGAYKVFIRVPQGGDKVAKVDLDSKTEGDVISFAGKDNDGPWTATFAPDAICGTHGDKGAFELKRVERRSPTLGLAPPKGATVLLDGKDFERMNKGKLRDGSEQEWKIVEGNAIEVPKGGMRTKPQFDGSFKLHVEFKCPLRATARGQGRGNSGVYLPNGSEIQVLDSFGMTTYKGGGCGGLYAYKDPDTFDEFSLASSPPLQWQTYDVEYHVQKKDGKPTGKPRVTVLHNGIKIHDNAELNNPAKVGGLFFQDHGNPVLYRNIWILPLPDEKPATTTPAPEKPKTEKPKTEKPKTEKPKAEKPKTEQPKTEKPKAEQPKTEQPKAEKPKTEQPKTEQPKSEKPKTEQPATAKPTTEKPATEKPAAGKP